MLSHTPRRVPRSRRTSHHRHITVPTMPAALGESKAHQEPSIPRAESRRERPGDREWGDMVLEPRTRQGATGATSPFLGRDRLCMPSAHAQHRGTPRPKNHDIGGPPGRVLGKSIHEPRPQRPLHHQRAPPPLPNIKFINMKRPRTRRHHTRRRAASAEIKPQNK